jgi:GNAT superfamily N-acetyltransferase
MQSVPATPEFPQAARPARIVLRLARPGDRADIVDLQRRSLREIGRGYYMVRQIESYLRHTETLEPYLIADGSYWVACAGGAIAGCGGWSLKAPAYAAVTREAGRGAGAPPPKVRAMYVHPDFVRRGIGRALLGEIEAAIASAGFGEAALDATLPGVALYERCGYRTVGETCAELPDGERLRFVCMRKALAPDAGGQR